MAPEEAPPSEDQPEPDASATEPSNENSTEFDPQSLPEEARTYLESREKELQGVMTKRTQEAAEQRREAENYRLVVEAASNPRHPQYEEALEYLGIPLEEDDQEEYLSDEEELAQRLERLEQAQSQSFEAAEQARMEDADLDNVASAIGEIQEHLGRDVEGAELRLVYSIVEQNRDPNGRPNAQTAIGVLDEAYGTAKEQWISSKRAPRSPGSGPAARKQFDIKDDKQRLDASAAAAEAAIARLEA